VDILKEVGMQLENFDIIIDEEVHEGMKEFSN